MPFFKLKTIFAYPGYGWQETWYNNTAANTAAALALAQNVIAFRTALLNYNTVVEEVQASQEPDPTWTMNTANVNPLQVRGDSQVGIPQGRTQQVINPVGTQLDADPWQSIQFMVQGTVDGTMNGPFYRRSVHLRGISINFWTVNPAGVVIWDGRVLMALQEYLTSLQVNNHMVRGFDKNQPFQTITGVAAGPMAGTLTLQTAVPLGVVPGQQLTITGWPRGQPGYNGPRRVIDLVGTNPVVVGAAPPIPPTPKSKCAIRLLKYFPLALVIPAKNQVTLPPLRLRKRDTGRDLWVSAGAKKRRASTTP